jgi:hypothetical protein
LYREAGRADLAAAADKKHRELLRRQAEMEKSNPPTNLTIPAKPGG